MTAVDAEARTRRKRRHWRLSAYLTGAFFLALVSLPPAEDREEGVGYAAGAFLGAAAAPLLIAVVLRFVYVKLIRRDGRRVVSPWILAVAVPVALLASAGRAASD